MKVMAEIDPLGVAERRKRRLRRRMYRNPVSCFYIPAWLIYCTGKIICLHQLCHALIVSFRVQILCGIWTGMINCHVSV
jgi:hypothetical protein